MKKDNRKQYLQAWVDYLKGKKEINYQELVKFLGEKFSGIYSGVTLKRYNSTLISNLIGNGYISGERGRGVKPGPLTIIKKISMPVLDKCLSRDSSKVRFAEEDLTKAEQSKISRGRVRKIQRKTVNAPQEIFYPRSHRANPLEKKKVIVSPQRKQRKGLSRTQQTAFYTAQQLLEQISVMEKQLAAYEKVFEKLRKMFSQEIIDVEELIERFLR
jgi:hypothetical protein